MGRARLQIVKIKCRRGCGKVLATTNRPIHATQADYDRFHGICDNCLTPEEKAEMSGPMLFRTARNIQRNHRG